MQITVHETQLHLETHPEYEFLLTNKEVALGYGITASTLRSNQNNHQDELIEGKHWIKKVAATKGGKQKVIHWTKKGIVRLGFFIKSQKAREFRDWAEDYVVNATAPTEQIQELQNIIMSQNKLIANQVKQTADDLFMNDSPLHNDFLDFLYQANKAVHEVNIIRHLSPKLDDTHQSLSNFMLHITRRYEKIRGVSKYQQKQ